MAAWVCHWAHREDGSGSPVCQDPLNKMHSVELKPSFILPWYHMGRNVFFTMAAAAHVCSTPAIYGCLRGRTPSQVSEPHKERRISPNGIIWPLLLSTMGSGLEETSLISKLISDAPKEQILWERKRWCAELHQIVRLPRNDLWESVLPVVKVRARLLLQQPTARRRPHYHRHC